MTQREQILEQALSLPPEDRAFVAAALEESLSTTASQKGSPAELLAELKRRSAADRAGRTSSRPATEVLADQRRRQAGEAEA